MNNFNEEKLPEGWEVKSLADIGNIFSGNSINTKLKEEKYTNKEGTPYVATKDISYNSVINYDNGINIPLDDVNKFRLAKSETILICAEGGSAGRKVGILNQDVYFVNKLFALETISEVNSKFCFYWYLSKEFKSNFKDKLKGLIGGVSKTDFKNLPIPIPPLKEQERIVAKIDTLFAKIDKAISLTEESLKQAENLLPSVLNEELSNIRDVSTVFTFSTLVDNFDSNRVPIKSNERDKMNGDYPYYGATGIIDYINEYIFDGEYLLISEDGANLVARKYPIAFIANGKFWVNNHAHIVQAKKKLTTNKFLEYFFANLDLSDFITGSAQPKLSQKKLNSIECFIPKLSTQTELCDLFDKYSLLSKKTQSKLEEQLAYLKQLKSSILSKAFKGEL